jgi:hypothetical protein
MSRGGEGERGRSNEGFSHSSRRSNEVRLRLCVLKIVKRVKFPEIEPDVVFVAGRAGRGLHGVECGANALPGSASRKGGLTRGCREFRGSRAQ